MNKRIALAYSSVSTFGSKWDSDLSLNANIWYEDYQWPSASSEVHYVSG